MRQRPKHRVAEIAILTFDLMLVAGLFNTYLCQIFARRPVESLIVFGALMRIVWVFWVRVDRIVKEMNGEK